MPFAIGAHVHIQSLGTGTVREIRGGGKYLVEIKGRSLIVQERQLSPADPRPGRWKTPPSTAPALPSRAHVPGSIDLHGMTADEADSALAGFLSDALLAGHAEVRVIHGRSGGRLKAAVHARLRATAAVHGFHIDRRNPGVTIVQF